MSVIIVTGVIKVVHLSSFTFLLKIPTVHLLHLLVMSVLSTGKLQETISWSVDKFITIVHWLNAQNEMEFPFNSFLNPVSYPISNVGLILATWVDTLNDHYSALRDWALYKTKKR